MRIFLMTDQLNHRELLTLTSQLVSAHVSNNTVAIPDLAGLIQQVYHTLASMGSALAAARAARPDPVVPIKKSVTPDYVICLEDGKKLKMLKRHLKTVYNMSVDEYRERWGLPADYPVVAPNYTKKRSMIAKTSGLGVSGRRRKLKVVSSVDQNHEGISQAQG